MLFKSLDRIPVVLILYGFIPFLQVNDEVFQMICDVPFDFRCNVNVVAFLQYLHKAACNYENVNNDRNMTRHFLISPDQSKPRFG